MYWQSKQIIGDQTFDNCVISKAEVWAIIIHSKLWYFQYKSKQKVPQI